MLLKSLNFISFWMLVIYCPICKCRNFQSLLSDFDSDKFETKSTKVFSLQKLSDISIILTKFLFETAVQLKNQLPDNMKILKKIASINSSCSLTDIALQLYSLVNIGIDVSSLEDKLQHLHHTSLLVNTLAPSKWGNLTFHIYHNLYWFLLIRLFPWFTCHGHSRTKHTALSPLFH